MSNWSDRVNQMTEATTYAQLQDAIEQTRAEVWRFVATVQDQGTLLEATREEMRALLAEMKDGIGATLAAVEERLRSIEADVAVVRARGDIEQMNDGTIVLG